MSRDGFLDRWSRLKAEAARRATPPEAPPAAAPAAAPPPEPELDPAEIAALPDPATATDPAALKAFLRRGVPALLRQAALRRIWLLDPAIRDYVDPALDYAWDFNAAAPTAPGWAALSAAERADELARRVAPADRAPEQAPEQDAAPGDPPAATEARGASMAAAPEQDEPPAPAATDRPAAGSAEPAAPRRRHGGAIPV
jgi:hypothetical protein